MTPSLIGSQIFRDEQCAIPSDICFYFAGNYLQLKKDRVLLFSEWIAKYGDHFGMYNGAEPVIVCSDLDTIKEVLVKVRESMNFCYLLFIAPRNSVPLKYFFLLGKSPGFN